MPPWSRFNFCARQSHHSNSAMIRPSSARKTGCTLVGEIPKILTKTPGTCGDEYRYESDTQHPSPGSGKQKVAHRPPEKHLLLVHLRKACLIWFCGDADCIWNPDLGLATS